ncbi:AraC family transcriptional regulator [Pseudonocardia spinosispora]|uniref:AraC family transcriptional regulator n=1 Tax=Pseudonocardia spinosispora TaxID=103441 RepID=UPI0003FB45E0|nr:AraC family transcriptional regulator [Pseudonocardia spinosispora]
MRDLIRASALAGYVDLVRELGGDPAPILAATRLRAELLGNTDAYIPFRSMARVIDLAAAELDRPDFSLCLAARQNIQILGPIALIARHSRTTRDALHGIAQHMGDYSPALRIALDDATGQQTRFTFEVLVPGIPSHAQIYQLGLGVSLGIFRLLMGSGFRPLLVSIPHAEPAHRDRYERFFDCRVRFDSDYAGLVLPSAELDRHRGAHDPDVREHVTRYLDAEGPADDVVVAQVRHLINRTLATGHATIRTVAAHLGLHPRTLQRWLAARDETFEAVLDEVRRERATAYLTQSTVSLGGVAAMLGYSQQSCLSRASMRWFGVPPSAVRAGRSGG